MSNEKRNFFFNKGNYILRLKPEIKKYFSPKTLIQFGLVLPYYIPFPEQEGIFFQINSEEVCHLFFTSFWDKQPIFTGTYKEHPQQVDIKKTRVEVTYFFKKKEKEILNNHSDTDEDEEDAPLENLLTITFDTSLNKLNNIIESYIAKTKDSKVHKLTKEHFAITIICRIHDPQHYEETSKYLFSVHMNAPDTHPTPLSDEETDEIMNFIGVIENQINPFIFGNEFMINARRSFAKGDYRNAVINAQIFVETLMYTIYREFLKQEDFSGSEVKEKSRDMKFKSLVIDQFKKRIGGDFNIDDKETRVGQWWENTYCIRNKIVHEGYHPMFSECDNAIYHATDVIQYIIELIQKPMNQQRYSQLLAYIVPNIESNEE